MIQQPETRHSVVLSNHNQRLLPAYFALAAVSFFWGTTYLGIRISLESLPPLYLIAIRYLISGSIMIVACKIARIALPSGRELRLTSVCGIISIGLGNGCLAIAETWIPSGLAALFITTSPFWLVGFDAILPHGSKPLLSTMGGLLVGLAGVAYLILPSALHEGWGGRTFLGFLLLQLGTAGWVGGALLQKRVSSSVHPFVTGAVQQFATGLAMFIPAALFEKAPTHIATRPALAVVYLICFGSIVGYSSFVYAMAKLPVALVSIYTYVNPIVAVFLGWLFFREPFGSRELAAMLIIFVGIGLVKWSESAKRVAPLVATIPSGGLTPPGE